MVRRTQAVYINTVNLYSSRGGGGHRRGRIGSCREPAAKGARLRVTTGTAAADDIVHATGGPTAAIATLLLRGALFSDTRTKKK